MLIYFFQSAIEQFCANDFEKPADEQDTLSCTLCFPFDGTDWPEWAFGRTNSTMPSN